MSADWQDPGAVSLMLDECETWAVVGLSGDTSRTAYSIASLLQQHGAWHLLCAAAAYLLFRHYAAERPREREHPAYRP